MTNFFFAGGASSADDGELEIFSHGRRAAVATSTPRPAELARAIADGARVRAFHTSSLLENFVWNDGYTQRYGLTYVDFRDQSAQ
jgi:hypothetical protein